MRALRWILFIVVAVIVVAVAVAYVLPREISVARTTDVGAPPAMVFPMVSDLRKFQDWSPWADRDPNVSITYTGPTEGVGQTMNWQSDHPEVGSGSMEVTEIEPDSRVDTKIDFDDQGTATSWIEVAPDGDGSRVTWGFRTDLGYNPIARYFGMSVEDAVAKDYEAGLAKLKELAEAEMAAAAEAERQAEEAARAEEEARKAAEEAARAAEEAARAEEEARRAAEEAAQAAEAAGEAVPDGTDPDATPTEDASGTADPTDTDPAPADNSETTPADGSAADGQPLPPEPVAPASP